MKDLGTVCKESTHQPGGMIHVHKYRDIVFKLFIYFYSVLCSKGLWPLKKKHWITTERCALLALL